MANEPKELPSLTGVGERLLKYSQQAEFTARRGAAAELFPYIFAASERMNARAISRFLAEEFSIKLSSVTIQKALNDPAKSWNTFFDQIEPHAMVFQKEAETAMSDFLFKDKVLKDGNHWALKLSKTFLFSDEFNLADTVLRQKWFNLDLALRLKARPYLAERLRMKEIKF